MTCECCERAVELYGFLCCKLGTAPWRHKQGGDTTLQLCLECHRALTSQYSGVEYCWANLLKDPAGRALVILGAT